MPSFVDNYEMLSFVAICDMLSLFEIWDVEFIWTHMTYEIYMRIYNHLFIVREEHVEIVVVEHIWDV